MSRDRCCGVGDIAVGGSSRWQPWFEGCCDVVHVLGCLLVLSFSQSQNIIDTSSNSAPLAVALNSY
jgi:hypothetical protein